MIDDRQQKVWWMVSGAYLLLLYLTLPLTPTLVMGMWKLVGKEETGWLFNAVLAIGMLLPLRWLARLPLRSLLLAIPPLLLALVLLNHIGNPSERLHLLMYAVLGGLFHQSMGRPSTSRGLFLVILLTALAGALDETIQALLPNRYGDLKDVGINTLGGALGVWLAHLLLPTPVRPR